MVKVCLKLNEEKILAEDKYSIQKMKKAIKELYQRHATIHCTEHEDGTMEFWSEDYYNDTGMLIGVSYALYDAKWFLDNVVTWTLQENTLENPNEFDCEDIRTEIHKVRSRMNKRMKSMAL